MCFYIVFQFQFQDMDHLFFQVFIFYREQDLHTAIQVSWHPVCTAHITSGLASLKEIENTAVFQEISYDGAHGNIFAKTGNSCFQAADTTDDQLYFYPCTGSVIKAEMISLSQREFIFAIM